MLIKLLPSSTLASNIHRRILQFQDVAIHAYKSAKFRLLILGEVFLSNEGEVQIVVELHITR